MTEYDATALAGVAACIQQPEDEHDQALQDIYNWYVQFFEKGLNPPVPQKAVKHFQALADPDEDWQQTVEMTIHLADATTSKPRHGYDLFQALRIACILSHFIR